MQKKVIVRRFSGDVLAGYLPVSRFVRATPLAAGWCLDLLDLSGRVVSVALDEVKMVCFVRDFNLGDAANPERILRRTFLARPRGEGLWVRVGFRSGDTIEGLAPLDFALVDDALEDRGLQMTPPDTRSNTQRIFVPRMSMTEFQILGVVVPRARSTAERPPTTAGRDQQKELFQEMESERGK